MTPIFKNAEIKFEDIGEYMQNYHKNRNNQNDIGNIIIIIAIIVVIYAK
jgi:hypothetical protein